MAEMDLGKVVPGYEDLTDKPKINGVELVGDLTAEDLGLGGQGGGGGTTDYEELENGKIMLLLSVRDTGIGIKEEDRKKLFESFQQVDTKRNRKMEGTGLGLSITKALVDLMDGTLSIESEYGKGSEFIVALPQIVMDDYKVEENKREREHKKFTAPTARLLVVDDNEMNRCKNFLRYSTYELFLFLLICHKYAIIPIHFRHFGK